MISKDKLQILVNELDQIKQELFGDATGDYEEIVAKLMLDGFKIAIVGEMDYYIDYLKVLDKSDLTVGTFKIVMLINNKLTEESHICKQAIKYWMKHDITKIDMNTVEQILLKLLQRN